MIESFCKNKWVLQGWNSSVFDGEGFWSVFRIDLWNVDIECENFKENSVNWTNNENIYLRNDQKRFKKKEVGVKHEFIDENWRSSEEIEFVIWTYK